jgi:DNA polymerase III alpha subunit
MILNNLDYPIFSSDDLIKEIYKGNKNNIKNCYIDTSDQEIIKYLEFIQKFNVLDWPIPNIFENNDTKKDLDKQNQDNWFILEEYLKIDIKNLLISMCNTSIEIERVQKELVLFEKYNLITSLKFLKYLVDTMRKNKLVWGVGRGSSVASFCLYLLGVHKINSIKYNLDIEEFFH